MLKIRNLLSQETKLTEEINLIEKMKLTLKSLKKDIEIKNKRLVEKQNLNKNSDEIKEEAAAKIRVSYCLVAVRSLGTKL